MRSAFISDLHAALRLPHARLDPTATTSDRLDDVCRVLDGVTDWCGARGVAQVFVLGDLFHARHPDAPTLHAVGRCLHRMTRAVERVYLLPGNHDAHDKGGRLYALSLFDALKVPGIHVFLDTEPLALGGLIFWPIPWVPTALTAERIDAAQRRLRADGEPNVLLLHHTIAGCLDGTRRVRQGLDPGELLRFDLVLSGHIHRPQTLGRARYLGSPLQLRASENDGERRGFWVLDHDRPQDLQLVPLDDTPAFVRWELTEAELLADHAATHADLHHRAALLAETLKARPVYLDVHLHGAAVDLYAADRALGEELDAIAAHERGLRNLRVNRVVTDDGSAERARAAARAGHLASTEDLVRAWITTSLPDLPPDEVRALTALGQTLLDAS